MLYICKIQLNRPALLIDGPTAEEEALTSQHFNYLSGLVEQGIALLVGRTLTTDLGTYGLIILQAGSEAEAWQIVNADPGVRNEVWQADLRPFRVALKGDLSVL